MKAVDSNVLVRYIVQDHPRQSELATDFLEGELSAESPGLVLDIVLVEVMWVLKRVYGVGVGDCQEVLERLLDAASLSFEDRDVVASAASAWKRQGGDFADALIVSRCAAYGVDAVVSFDRGAARHGMKVLDR